MDEQLAAALTALLLSLAALLRDELARRRIERRQHELGRQVVDVSAKIGANRRAGDSHHPALEEHRTAE